MGNTDIICDFLVSLGFQVDESGMRKFQRVLTSITANVLKMGATVEGAALSVVGFTTKIAALYWSSQRTGSTVAGMKALTFAAAQTGSSAEAAQGALESLARLIQGAGAVIDWWKRLDEGSKNLLKIFGALLVAWRLLNSSFLMSPIGFITSLILAIGLLIDDYQTWKEGSSSLILTGVSGNPPSRRRKRPSSGYVISYWD